MFALLIMMKTLVMMKVCRNDDIAAFTRSTCLWLSTVITSHHSKLSCHDL